MTSNPYESPTFGNSLSLRVDGSIGAMSLAPNGRDAVLAGRRGLFIIDLDDPFTTPRWLHHITSWEVADVQWLPHSSRPSWCISTSNQKALLWDLARPSHNAIQNVLHKHTRAITDINFHPHDPDMLATCLVDTFVYSWDMRTPRRPVGKWAEWRAGATQVKWNHRNAHQVCLSHSHSFFVWDTRHGARPLVAVENAHGGKINGLDFLAGRLVTCANDNAVKVWDLDMPRDSRRLRVLSTFRTRSDTITTTSGAATGGSIHGDSSVSGNGSSDLSAGNPEFGASTDPFGGFGSAPAVFPTVTIRTTYPVARARPLPFGRDSCCGIMPVRGGDNSVHVVNYDAVWREARGGSPAIIDADAAYTFKGHRGAIKDFLWRTQHAWTGRTWREYQLVTWSSQDYDLKLWQHDPAMYDAVNYHPGHQRIVGLLGESKDVESEEGENDEREREEVSHSLIELDTSVKRTETETESGGTARMKILESTEAYDSAQIQKSVELHSGVDSNKLVGVIEELGEKMPGDRENETAEYSGSDKKTSTEDDASTGGSNDTEREIGDMKSQNDEQAGSAKESVKHSRNDSDTDLTKGLGHEHDSTMGSSIRAAAPLLVSLEISLPIPLPNSPQVSRSAALSSLESASNPALPTSSLSIRPATSSDRSDSVGSNRALSLPGSTDSPQSSSAHNSLASTPESEISEDQAMMPYTSYCSEPPLTSVVTADTSDVLSTWTMFKIRQRQETEGRSTQVNHLNWISGVRMGTARDDDDDPANLGEEVSVVGHKFPKIRFEKILVSTGHLVLLMRGPLSYNDEKEMDRGKKEENEEENEEKNEEKNETANENENQNENENENENKSKSKNDKEEGKDNDNEREMEKGKGNVKEEGNENKSEDENGNEEEKKKEKKNENEEERGETGKQKDKEGRERKNSVDSDLLNTSSNAQNVPSAHTLLKGISTGTLAAPKGTSIPQNIPQTIPGLTIGNPPVRAPMVSATATASETTPPTSAEQEQKLVFIRLEIRLPKMYPYLEQVDRKMRSKQRRANLVRFDIEETHELTARVKKEMLDKLDRITQFYTNKYNKFCLEPCLRYLLGDKIELNDSLMVEASTASVKNLAELAENVHDDSSEMPEVVVSGEDEDDFDGDIMPAIGDLLARSDEFEKTTNDTAFQHSNADGNMRQDSTPVPKGCGAVWSRNGQLVCFFIPKGAEHESEKTLQKFNVFKFTESAFRLKHQRLGSVDSGTDSESVSSDDERGMVSSDSESKLEDDSGASDSGSSDDSFSNDWDEMLEDDVPSRSRIPGLFKGSVGLGRRILAQGNGKGSFNKTLSGRGTGSNYRSSLHDDNNLRSTSKTKRPKKGKNIVTVLDFSHLIPDKYELACDYRVLGDTPDSLARHNCAVAMQYGFIEIANVWKVVEMILVKDVHLDDVPDIGRDLMYPSRDESGRFYWGNHPFGHAWLVKELFTHFEKRGNLQMLAMLSCILFENLANVRSSLNGEFSVPIHTPYSAVPPRPSLIAMREYGLITPHMEASAANAQLIQTSYFDPSPVSRKNSALSGLGSLLSHLVTESIDQPLRSDSPGKLNTIRKMLPGSPYMEALSPMEQSNMRLARLFDITKKFPKGPVASKRSRSIQMRKVPTMNNGSFQKWRQRSPPIMTVEMKNVAELDLFDNVYANSLLSELDPATIWSYRDQYADMLYSWGLPFHRIKILKFNFPEEARSRDSPSVVDEHECKYGFRYRKALAPNQLLLTPITTIPTSNHNAWNTRKRNKTQYCGLCGLPITKRVVICTNCEHVLHSHCAVTWWSAENKTTEDDVLECATGCGCHCLDYGL